MFFSEIISVEVPKSPVRRGKRGCSIGRFSVANPRNPARRKTSRVFRISFSFRIRKSEMKIRIYGRID